MTLEHKESTGASKIRKEDLEEGVRVLKFGLHLFPYVCMCVLVGGWAGEQECVWVT